MRKTIMIGDSRTDMMKDVVENDNITWICEVGMGYKWLRDTARELEKFGLIERKRRGLGKPSLVYVKNFSAESSKSIFQNRDFHDSGGFKNASQDPSKSRCNKTKENDTEMSETDPFNSEEIGRAHV